MAKLMSDAGKKTPRSVGPPDPNQSSLALILNCLNLRIRDGATILEWMQQGRVQCADDLVIEADPSDPFIDRLVRRPTT
jgi:hypothetical protein